MVTFVESHSIAVTSSDPRNSATELAMGEVYNDFSFFGGVGVVKTTDY